MKRITKKRLAFGVMLLLLYVSKPDKGGAWACSEMFELPELSSIELDHKPFWHWELFESSKYRFNISPEEFLKLKSLLATEGYSEWKREGLTFDSISIGWNGDEDFIVTVKYGGGIQYYWSYSRNLNVVYAIKRNN